MNKRNLAIFILSAGWACVIFCLTLWVFAMTNGGAVLLLTNNFNEGWAELIGLVIISSLHPWAIGKVLEKQEEKDAEIENESRNL